MHGSCVKVPLSSLLMTRTLHNKLHTYTSARVCFVTPRVPTREEFGGRWPWTATYVSNFSSSFYGKATSPRV